MSSSAGLASDFSLQEHSVKINVWQVGKDGLDSDKSGAKKKNF